MMSLMLLFSSFVLIIVVLLSTVDATSSIRSFYDQQSAMVRSMSTTNLNSKGPRHNCTSPCSARYSFNGTIARPVDCPARMTSYQCVAQVEISFEAQAALVTFLTSGTEYSADSVTMLIAHQVTYSYASNSSSITMMFGCFVNDDCDWTFIEIFLKRHIQLNLAAFFDPYRSLFVDSTNRTNLQCYTQNNPTNCPNGLCSAIVVETKSGYVNRSCLLSGSGTRLDVLRLQVLPQPNSLGLSYFEINCNRNLCNNATNEVTLKDAIAVNSSLFDPTATTTISPSNSISFYTNKSIFLNFLLLFVVFFCISHQNN